MVEPGVTFGELIAAVAEKGLRLNMPLQPRATKSVVGSMLSREPVIMPHYHWDISDPIGSTEVVFGTGDMFRTGAAAGPGDIAAAASRRRRAERSGRSFGHVAPPPAAGCPGHHGHRDLGVGQMRADARKGAALLHRLERRDQAPGSGSLADPSETRQRAADPERRRLRRSHGRGRRGSRAADRQAAAMGALLQPCRLQVLPRHAAWRGRSRTPGTCCSGSACRPCRTSAGWRRASSWRPSAGRRTSPTGSSAGRAAARTSSS